MFETVVQVALVTCHPNHFLLLTAALGAFICKYLLGGGNQVRIDFAETYLSLFFLLLLFIVSFPIVVRQYNYVEVMVLFITLSGVSDKSYLTFVLASGHNIDLITKLMIF